MRRIVIFLGLFFFALRVDAYETGKWTDEIIDELGFVIVSNELRYRWYENIIEFSPEYYIEGENNVHFPFICNDDFIENDFTDWTDEVPAYKERRYIENILVNRYRTLRAVRYLFFNDFVGGFTTFKVAELNILVDNQRITYDLSCNGCSSNFKNDVQDGLYSDKAYINNGGNMVIDLGSYYGIDQIKVELFMYDPVPSVKKFTLHYNEGDLIFDRNYAKKEVVFYTVSSNPFQPERYLIEADASFIHNPTYNDWIYIDGYVNSTYYRQMQTTNLYRYKDVKYRYYRVERKYLDDYYLLLTDDRYIKDDESAKTYYLYEYTENNTMNDSGDNEKKGIIANDKINPGNSNENKSKKIAFEGSVIEERVNTSDKEVDILSDIIPIYEEKQHNIENIPDQNKGYLMISIFLIVCIGVLCLILKRISHILSYQK